MPSILPAFVIMNFCHRQLQQTTLPDVAGEFEEELVHSQEVTVTSIPTLIAFLPHQTFTSVNDDGFDKEVDSFLQKVKYSENDRNQTEMITRGQNQNLEWFSQRMGSVTSSVIGEVHRLANGD